MSQRQTLDTPQEMQNMGFDPTFQVAQIELLGHDSANSVLRRIQVDDSGNLKIDPTNLDARYLKLDVSNKPTINSLTRDANNFLATITLSDSRVLTIARNASNFITSITDGTWILTITRDASNLITKTERS